MGRLKAHWEGDLLILEGKDVKKLHSKGYGEIRGERLELDLVEAAYLIKRGVVEVEVNFKELLKKMAAEKRDNFLKFVVYSDLRDKSFVVVQERRTPFLRIYPPGARIGEKVGKQLALPLQEEVLLSHKELIDALVTARRLRKELLLAVVDDRLDVIYYTASLYDPEKINRPLPELSGEGTLIYDRVFVWDTDMANELYSSGFWGHPVGLKKVAPGTRFEEPLQLNIFEALYLNKKGILEIKDPLGSTLSSNDLENLGRQIKRNFDDKMKVFTYWRDLGYVVKPAPKYGVHYMIYKEGPGLDHAPYLCLVSKLTEKVSPIDIIRAGRIASSVRKELVVSVITATKLLNYRVFWSGI